MLETLAFIVTSLLIGVVFSLPGIAFGHYLEKRQVAPNRFVLVLIFSTLLVFLKRIWLNDLPYILLAIIIVLGTTAGMYKMDFYWSMKTDKTE